MLCRGDSLVGRELQQLDAATLVLRHAFSMTVHIAKSVLRFGITLVRRQLPIHSRLCGVLRDTSAVATAVAKVVLCARVALIGSVFEEGDGTAFILGHTRAMQIAHSEVELRIRVA